MAEANPNERIELGEVAANVPGSFVDGPFGSNLKTSEYVDEGVRLIQLQNIGDGYWVDSNRRFISEVKYQTLQRHGATPGDIAIAKMADPVARACVLPRVAEKFLVVADCVKLRPDPDRFDANFVCHAINSQQTRREAETKSSGTTRLRINLSALKTVHIWAPPLSEQRRVAEILNTVDDAILHTERLIAKLQQTKQGLLFDLLTRGIDERGELRDPERHPEEFKDSPVGHIPLRWEVQPLEHWVRPDAPITYGIVQAGPNIPSGVPYIRTGDMAGDRLSLSGLLRTSGSIAKAYKRSEVRSGEIVCAIRATVGKVLVVPQELDGANLTQGTARISPGVRVHGGFLLWAIRGRATQSQIARQKKGTTFQEITLGQLRQLLVAIPISKDEQSFIAELMEGYEARQRTESTYLAKVQALRTGINEGLLTGRVRVSELLGGAA